MNIARKARSPLHGRLHQLHQNWNSAPSVTDTSRQSAPPETPNMSRDLARILKASRDGKFDCPFSGCCKTFVNRLSVLNHFELHVTKHPFPCSYCEKIYETPIQRHEHVGRAHSGKSSVQKCVDSQDDEVQYVKKEAWNQMEKWASRNSGNRQIHGDDDYGEPPDIDCMVDQDQTPPPPSLQGHWGQNDNSGGSQGGQAEEQPQPVSTGPSLQNIKAFYASKRLKLSKRPTRFPSKEKLTVQRRITKIKKCRTSRQQKQVPADCELCDDKHYTCQSSYIRHARGIHWKWLPFKGLHCEFCDGKLFEDILLSSDAEIHYTKHSRQLRRNGTMFLDGYGKNGLLNLGHHTQLNDGRPHQNQMIDNCTSGGQNSLKHDHPTQWEKSTDLKPINRQLFGTRSRSDKMQQSTFDTGIYRNSAKNTYASPPSSNDRVPSAFPPFGLLTPMSSSGSSSYGNLHQSPAYINNGFSRNVLGSNNFNSVLQQDENELPTKLPVISNAEAIKNTATVCPTAQFPIVKMEPPDVIEIPAAECQAPVQRFPCPYTHCGSSFSTEEKLEAHKRKHNMVRKVLCKRCGKTVYTRGAWKYCSPCVAAMKKEAESEAYKPKSWVMLQCFECNATFDSELNLVSHLKAEHMDPQNQKPRECPVCSFTLENVREFYSHTRAHAFDRDRPLTCKDPTKTCQQQFKNEEDLTKHLRAAHPDLDLVEVGVVAEPPPELVESKPKIRRAEEPVKAVPKLGFFKPRRRLFKAKPVPIPVSAPANATLPVLTLSTKQNDSERVFPYPKNMCYICFCSFSDENTLATHVIYTHGRTLTTYNCGDCNYLTTSASAYQKHNVEHQREFPHCCPQPRCFKKCRTLIGLQLHLQDHQTAEAMKLSASLLPANGYSNEKIMLKSSDTQK